MASGGAKPSRSGVARGEWFKFVLLTAVVVALVLAVSWRFVRPAPPQRVVIATGQAGGYYHRVATQYAEFFRLNGMELVVRETAGSIENLQLLSDDDSDVDIAILQGGITSSGEHDVSNLRAVATIGFEPVWVFYRAEQTWTKLTELAGRRIAIGAPGSGVAALARQLLAENRLGTADDTLTTQVELGGAAAAKALNNGEVDVAFFITAPTTPVIAQLLQTPGMKLMHFQQANAYARRHRFLSAVTLYEGVVDLPANLPGQDVRLIAPAAVIVVDKDVHPAVIQLLVYAAQTAHRDGDVLTEPGQFPSANLTDLPVADEARYHLTHGPSFLQRHLPFWLTSIIDRLLILLIPLLVVLIPLMRFLPPVYRWQIRSRIYRWYKKLRGIDTRLRDDPSLEQVHIDHDALNSLEKEITGVKVPLSYMQEFYNLRLHVAYLRTRLEVYEREHAPRRDGKP